MGATPAAPPAGAAATAPPAGAVATAPAPTVPSLRFTDTHCHIHDRATYDFALRRHLSDSKKFRRLDVAAQTAEFERRRRTYAPAELTTRAAAAGVHRLICIGTDPADSLVAANFAAAPTTSAASAEIFWAYGVHPDETAHIARDHATDIQNLPAATRACLVAIGEVGLDYHESSDPATRAAQIRLLEAMLDLATRLDLPLIFHIRAAFDDFFAVLANFSTPIRGVVHSFSDSPANLARCLDRGFYIGVNGLATFADIPLPPLDRLVLETDAPFLAPVPHRGAVNEPAFVPDIAAKLAPRLHASLADLATTTEQNATQLFGL